MVTGEVVDWLHKEVAIYRASTAKFNWSKEQLLAYGLMVVLEEYSSPLQSCDQTESDVCSWISASKSLRGLV